MTYAIITMRAQIMTATSIRTVQNSRRAYGKKHGNWLPAPLPYKVK